MTGLGLPLHLNSSTFPSTMMSICNNCHPADLLLALGLEWVYDGCSHCIRRYELQVSMLIIVSSQAMFILKLHTFLVFSNHLKTGLFWFLFGRFVSRCPMMVWKPECKELVKMSGIKWSIKSRDQVSDIHTVQYSNESCVRYSVVTVCLFYTKALLALIFTVKT